MELHAPSSKHATLLLNGGLLDPATMRAVPGIARQYNLLLHCTTFRNLRLLAANNDNSGKIKDALLDMGLQIKAPGKFSLSRVARKVTSGLTEAEALVAVGRLVEYHASRTQKKQRLCKLLENDDFPYPLRN